jgi:CrcB protein
MIAIAGAVGTLARFGLVEASRAILPQPSQPTFPWGTLAVNLLGCFAIGALATAWTSSLREEFRLAILVGLLGGFTTFSSFAWEAHSLWSAGKSASAVLYVTASVGFGLALVWCGARLAAAVLA